MEEKEDSYDTLNLPPKREIDEVIDRLKALMQDHGVEVTATFNGVELNNKWTKSEMKAKYEVAKMSNRARKEEYERFEKEKDIANREFEEIENKLADMGLTEEQMQWDDRYKAASAKWHGVAYDDTYSELKNHFKSQQQEQQQVETKSESRRPSLFSAKQMESIRRTDAQLEKSREPVSPALNNMAYNELVDKYFEHNIAQRMKNGVSREEARKDAEGWLAANINGDMEVDEMKQTLLNNYFKSYGMSSVNSNKASAVPTVEEPELDK